MVVVDFPQSIECRIYAPFIPYGGVILLGGNRCFKANRLVYLLAETSVYIPYPFVDVHTACCIRNNVTLFIEGVLITLVACELSLYTIRHNPQPCVKEWFWSAANIHLLIVCSLPLVRLRSVSVVFSSAYIVPSSFCCWGVR